MKNILDNLSKKIKLGFLLYALGLVRSQKFKSCKAIGSIFGFSHDFIYRFLSKKDLLLPLFPSLMFGIANKFSKEKSGWLIFDDTTISKTFSRLIEGAFDIFNTALKLPDRGFNIVVIAWSNGEITVPLKFDFYFHKEIVGKEYRTKSFIAKQLLTDCIGNVQFDYVLADAHYSTIELLMFLTKKKIDFTGKIPRNRIVRNKKGNRTQLQMQPGLKLLRNSRNTKISANYLGMQLFFSAHKRKMKSGDFSVVYLVSTLDVNPKQYMEIYDGRWSIECMFRTMKQYLGLAQCAARDIEKQKLHMFTTFFSYAFLQNIKSKNNFKNPEGAIRHLQKLKIHIAINRIVLFYENFQCFA